MENKVLTYLGFAKKSNNIIFGIDKLQNYNKKIHLIILCKTANEKYLKTAQNIRAKNKNCTVLITKVCTLNELLNTDNCKIIGIKNLSLSKAIIDNMSDILLGVN